MRCVAGGAYNAFLEAASSRIVGLESEAKMHRQDREGQFWNHKVSLQPSAKLEHAVQSRFAVQRMHKLYRVYKLTA